jgi:hypothetical protein
LLFVYGAVATIGEAGRWLMLVLPALGLGAFAAAGALLLPRFRWLALTLPGLAFPFTFRFTKPWENMAAMSAVLAFGILFYVIWRNDRRRWALYAHLAAVLVAISIRPDQAHLVGGLSLLGVVVVAKRHERAWLVTTYALMAVVAVGVFLSENLVVTGDPLLPPVYLLEGAAGAEIAGKQLPVGISHVAALVVPKGIAAWDVITSQTSKYWWQLGPMWIVTTGAIATIAVVLVRGITRRRFRTVLVLLAAVALMALFFVSRINTTDWGADQIDPSLGHSLPRYSALLYATTGLTALWGIAKAMTWRRWMAAVGVTGLMLSSWMGIDYLIDGEVRTSLSDATELIRAYELYADELDAEAPENALFYARFVDKFAWAVRPTALLPTEPGSTREHIDYSSLVRSVEEASAYGYVPVLFELDADDVRILTPLLGDLGFSLTESTMGRTEYLDGILIRWETWVVGPAGPA